jgi:hypothetical protein
LLETHHIGQTRYTTVARRIQAEGGWPANQPLPVTLDEAEASFKATLLGNSRELKGTRGN